MTWSIFVDRLVGPAGRTDWDAIVAALQAELDLRLGRGVRLDGPLQIGRLRIDPALTGGRLDDPRTLGAALARAIVSALDEPR